MKRTYPIVFLVATLIIVAAISARQLLKSIPCTLHPPHAEKSDERAGTEYFSATYTQARQQFVDAAQRAGARIEHFPNSHKGPDGGALYTDVVLLGAENASQVLVLSSATHGVEGFAGSAIQSGLLKEDIVRHLPPDTALLMIHAINPYGMAHLRRFNEENVDVNRNFVDHSKAYPVNDAYGELVDAISPPGLSWWGDMRSGLQLLWYGVQQGLEGLQEAISTEQYDQFVRYGIQQGKDGLRKAISSGQYSHPQGLFYGGSSPSWSNHMLRAVISKYLGRAGRVVFVDIHTGLGSFATAEVIISEDPESAALTRARRLWGPKVRNTFTGESVSVQIDGAVKRAIVEMLPEAEVTAVSLEFGTYPVLDVFRALRAENWLYRQGNADVEDASAIKACLLEAFRPHSATWEEAVWRQGRQVILEGITGLTEPEVMSVADE